MTVNRSLPVLMPKVVGQRWSCHSCGDCCRTLVGHISDEERRRLDEQGWADELGRAPYVRIRGGWALNKHSDGACVFLDENNRCRIHARHGEQAKPLACRIFPFSVRPTRAGWQASLRFDCPSVIASKGQPIAEHRRSLAKLAERLDEADGRIDDFAELRRGVRASRKEIETVNQVFIAWLRNESRPMIARLIGAARVTATLAEAKLHKVRGRRFAELLELLFASQELTGGPVPGSPTVRQRGMLRQLAFAHTEHVTLQELRGGAMTRIGKRCRQLRTARRMLKGQGEVPALRGFTMTAPTWPTFDEVERVEPAGNACQVLPDDDLLTRYLTARLEGRTIFGPGYYGWPVISGLSGLWLSIAVAGWLSRYAAAVRGNRRFDLQDVGCALGVVDRAATRVPALGSLAERMRQRYLVQDEGVARLLYAFAIDGGRP